MQAKVIRFVESTIEKILTQKESEIHKGFIYLTDRLRYYPHFNIQLLRRSSSFNKILAALKKGNQAKLLYVYTYFKKIIQGGQIMELLPKFNSQLPRNLIKVPELNYFQNIHKFECQNCRECYIRNFQIPLGKYNNPMLLTCFQNFIVETKPSISQMVCSLANQGGGKILIVQNKHQNIIYEGFPHISQQRLFKVRSRIQNAIRSIQEKDSITFQARKRSLKFQIMAENRFEIQQIMQIQIKVKQNKNPFILKREQNKKVEYKIFNLYFHSNQWLVKQVQNQYKQIINLHKVNRNVIKTKVSCSRTNEYKHLISNKLLIQNKISLKYISELIDNIRKEDIVNDFPKIQVDQSIILVNFINMENYKIVQKLFKCKQVLFKQIIPFKNLQNKISQYMNYQKFLVYFIIKNQNNKQISKQLKKILNKQTIYEITSKNSMVIHSIKENQLSTLMQQIKRFNFSPFQSKQLNKTNKLNQISFKVVIKFPSRQTIGIVLTCLLLIYADLRFQIKTN